MYLTRMAINVARPSAKRLLGSTYSLHAAVEAAFPPGSVTSCEEGRVLWRLDLPPARELPTWLYIASPERPDLTHVVEQAGWPAVHGDGWDTRDYAPLLGRIAAGQRWSFRLKANPSREVATDAGLRPKPGMIGKVVGHATVAQQEGWLLSRASKHGFRVCTDVAMGPLLRVLWTQKEQFKRKDDLVTICTAQYDGVLEVVDPDAFRRLLCHGIGRAKGFGCGLMTIAPVGQ